MSLANFFVKSCTPPSTYLLVRLSRVLAFSSNFAHIRKSLKGHKRLTGFTPLKVSKKIFQIYFRCGCRRRHQLLTGFTLIELVVTISILVMIGSIAMVSFVHSRNTRDLGAHGQNVLSVLRTAQAKSLGSENNDTWGVHFHPADNPREYILFRGASEASAAWRQSYLFPANLEFSDLALAGGGEDVVFRKIKGDTATPGSLNVRITGTTLTFPITIDASGKVFRTGSAPVLTGSRLLDARHRLFTLGWSIQNSTTLTLTFSDPPSADTVVTVGMAPYFDGPKTVFDWSGTPAVGGQTQDIRIHTTSLTSGNTALSVDRDCRKNTKKLRISIDGSNIATYEADCRTITVGSGGGVMSEP